MIQKAIIEDIIDNYTYRVRIPKYNKSASDGYSFQSLPSAILSSLPNSKIAYAINDVVLVAFENEEIDRPVIIGLLYREANFESEASINLIDIEDKLNNITTNLNTVLGRQSQIFVKYSNDGGVTFTSLYEYSDETYVDETDTYSYYTADSISIDKNSTHIYWNVVDSNSRNVRDSVQVTTTLTGLLDDNIYQHTSTDFDIEIPEVYRHMDSLSISYKLVVLVGDKSDYNISLFTDRNAIGSVEGDYIGFYYSIDGLESTNPVEYSWASIKTRLQKFIDDAFDNLLSRVQTNERYLYGKAKEDETSTNLGVSSAIAISANSLDISNKDTIILTDSVSVDTNKNSIKLGNALLKVASNGHLVLKRN